MRSLLASTRCLSQSCGSCASVAAKRSQSRASPRASAVACSTAGAVWTRTAVDTAQCSSPCSSTDSPCPRLETSRAASTSTSSSFSSTSISRRTRTITSAAAGGRMGPGKHSSTPPLPPPPPPSNTKYSPLHANIEEFCQRLTLTEDEQRARHEVIEVIRQSAAKAYPDYRDRVRVELFGSFATGMSAWHSDVDLVITGLLEPDRTTGRYDIKDRGRVTARLRALAEQLRKHKKLDITRCSIISRARMPIIKLYTRRNVAVDISISDSNGVLAARYMANQVAVYPPLRPLTLVLKAYLRSQRLLDVATGGLSSYSLCNMIVAHLQEELKHGRDIYDLGETLYGFFLRYSEEFDYEVHAVSIRTGGVVPKRLLPFAMDSARFAASTQAFYAGAVSWHERLCVDCPVTGRDVSNGTYRIDVVRRAFYRAARQLEALAKGRSISDSSINYLSALFDVQRVLKRMHIDEDPFFKVIKGPMDQDEDEEDARARKFEAQSWDSSDEGEELDGGDLADVLGDDLDDALESEASRSPKGAKGTRGR